MMIQTKIFRILKVTVVMAICIRCVDEKLLVRPRKTVSLVGHLTYFNCSTEEPDGKILWLNGNTYIYAGDKILNFDGKRFSVELDKKTGSCNLVIRNVTMEDAGSYICKDIKDIDDHSVAALTVLASAPVCWSNANFNGLLGPNDCKIVPEVLSLSCIVTYHGYTPPTLQWKSAKHRTSVITGGEPCKVFRNDTLNGGRVECDLTVKAELYLHNSSFVCQTNSSVNGQYSCSSGPIKVLHAFSSLHVIEKTVDLDEKVQCSANSTAQCDYKWLLNNTVIDHGSSIVTLRRPGFHRCEAMCDMRGRQCSVTAMLVHVSTGPEPKTRPDTSTATSVLAIISGLLHVLSITSIIYLFLCSRRSKDKGRRINVENHDLENRVSTSSPTNENIIVTDGHTLLHTERDELLSELEPIIQASELASKCKELEDKQKELDATQNKLEDKQKTVEDMQKKLEDMQKKVEDMQKEVENSKKELINKIEVIAEKIMKIEKKNKELENENKELNQSIKLLEDRKSQFTSRKKQLGLYARGRGYSGNATSSDSSDEGNATSPEIILISSDSSDEGNGTSSNPICISSDSSDDSDTEFNQRPEPKWPPGGAWSDD